MYCRDCGEKLTLRFLQNEGLVPYCPNCTKFKFPFFPIAVSMTVVNRAEDKILLAKHTGEEGYKLLAGYVKKGETPEKAIVRELKEETDLNAVKWRYVTSRYHEAKEVLMLNYIVTSTEGETTLNDELESVRWCTREEASALVVKGSTAAYFLNAALNELGKKR